MTYDVADRLIQMRRRRGLSQGDLARALGLSRQAVSKWERGESSPDTNNLIALATLYGVTLDELVGPLGDQPAGGVSGEAGVLATTAVLDGPHETYEVEDVAAGALGAVSGGDDASVAPDSPCQQEASDTPADDTPSPSVRLLHRRYLTALGALVVVFALIGAAGWFVLTGPHTHVTDMLGITGTFEDEVAFAGIERVVVNWPAGEVEMRAGSADGIVDIQEHSPDNTKMGNYRVEGTTLEVWAGNTRGWDDPDAPANDLAVTLPLENLPAAPHLNELVLNTRSGHFAILHIEGTTLNATLRDGSLTMAHCTFEDYRLS
ncbi:MULTISPECIES: helix-turn-helix transcriptional regulator [Gordonibacter]|uniref:Helix-turn-helix transcriptional regulator n=1 Tax=Gordonibacter faecis TaxID=3047475 RepID=A0ABT7DPN0_9ACTN|nr:MULTISPECIES: helix-turn-helix transcriptional regulator [unclassified Gordonibacter]MDJ1650493.1 helix-turn-helix transcriptional regulator [Gordonibacter sp. KGMB12511]HIW77420.1 helix-turn-helix domain-containing protein [Candidatus Gordonibacter avicola]